MTNNELSILLNDKINAMHAAKMMSSDDLQQVDRLIVEALGAELNATLIPPMRARADVIFFACFVLTNGSNVGSAHGAKDWRIWKLVRAIQTVEVA